MPALENRPELYPDLVPVVMAWRQLCWLREPSVISVTPAGPVVAAGPYPLRVEAITAYLDELDYDRGSEEREEAWYYILELEGAWLAHQRDEAIADDVDDGGPDGHSPNGDRLPASGVGLAGDEPGD